MQRVAQYIDRVGTLRRTPASGGLTFSLSIPILRPFVAAVPILALSSTAALAQVLAIDLTGTWAFSVVTENGTGTPTVTMKQQGDSLSGTYESGRMGIVPFKGTIKDSTFTFSLNTSGGATLTFKGAVVNANLIKGDVDFGGQGGATFTGERKK